MPTAPKRNIDEVAERVTKLVNDFIRSKISLPSEFEIRRLEQLAKEYIDSDPNAAYTLLAAISGIKLDKTLMDGYFTKALQSSPGSGYTHHNYSLLSSFFCDFQKAKKMAEKAQYLDPYTKNVMSNHLHVCLTLGRFHEAVGLLQSWQGQRTPEESNVLQNMKKACDLLDGLGAEDDDTQEFLQPVFGVLSEANAQLSSVVLFPHDWYGPQHISLRYFLKCSVEEGVDLEWRLAEKCVEFNDRLGLEDVITSEIHGLIE